MQCQGAPKPDPLPLFVDMAISFSVFSGCPFLTMEGEGHKSAFQRHAIGSELSQGVPALFPCPALEGL